MKTLLGRRAHDGERTPLVLSLILAPFITYRDGTKQYH